MPNTRESLERKLKDAEEALRYYEGVAPSDFGDGGQAATEYFDKYKGNSMITVDKIEGHTNRINKRLYKQGWLDAYDSETLIKFVEDFIAEHKKHRGKSTAS